LLLKNYDKEKQRDFTLECVVSHLNDEIGLENSKIEIKKIFIVMKNTKMIFGES
jgi:hypothetical protein